MREITVLKIYMFENYLILILIVEFSSILNRRLNIN